MKRRPQGWPERFAAALEAHPSPALEDWRWAREGEDPVDSRAVDAAWDLVTLAASAEANKLNHAMRLLDTPEQKTLLPSMVVAGVRVCDVGAFKVVDTEGKHWFPRDLAFIPGRENLAPELVLECNVEVGRSVCDFRLWYRHTSYESSGDELKEASAERYMAVLLTRADRTHAESVADRQRDIELGAEGYLVVRYERSEVWADPVACAVEAIRTLRDSTRFDADEQLRG